MLGEVFLVNDKNFSAKHNVIMENREKLTVSGINEVESFDEQTVVLKSTMGNMTVKGDDLKVSSFDVQTGDLHLTGNIVAIVYTT